MSGGRFLVAAAVAASLVAAGLVADRVVGPAAGEGTPAAAVASGSWQCPHGGGPGWRTTVTVVNPGDRPARFRLSTFDEGTADRGAITTLAPGAEVALDVPSGSRAAASSVEWFDAWVAAGWTSVAEGEEVGLAAEPCVDTTHAQALLPDNTTLEGEHAYIVVMNPFAADAVFSLEVTTPDRRILPEAWADVVLEAGRSAAFHLNPNVLGDETVAARVVVSIGRVATASLGVTRAGGIRSAVGIAGQGRTSAWLPAGGDAGAASVVVLNQGDRGVTVGTTVTGTTSEIPQGLPHEVVPAESSATFAYTVADPGVLEIVAEGGAGGIGIVRRSGSPAGDRGSVPARDGPGPAWVLPSPRDGASALGMTVYLSNPGDADIHVVLAPIGVEGSAPGAPSEVVVPAGGIVAVPGIGGATGASVLAVSDDGEFVPVVASTGAVIPSYALAMGVPIPPAWRP